VSELDPPPSIVELVGDQAADAIWKRWFYFVYEKIKELVVAEVATQTAFGEQTVGQLYPQFQNTFEYTVSNTDLTTNTIVNGGTVTQSQAMAVVGTSTTTTSSAELKSVRHARYRAGLGGLVRFTALFTTGVALTEQYIGLADEAGSTAAYKNGLMVGYDGATFGFHRFQNDVKISVALSAWDDPLDGTGASKLIIDTTKLNIFYIQFQYLGAGAIKLFYENSETGKMELVHTVQYANSNTVPSSFNPNYYFHIWADNKSTTSNIVVKNGSYAFFIEGKTQHIELHQPLNSSQIISKSSVTTQVALFTIRNKSLYASKSNFIDAIIQHYSVSVEANSANNLAALHFTINATLGGTPSYSDINTTNSVMDIDTSATTVTGGRSLIHAQLAGKNDRIIENIDNLGIILSPGDTLTLSVESANSATFKAHMLWKELF